MSFEPSQPFDPFGDFATQGYLRNSLKLKDAEKIVQLEHLTFLANIDRALVYLQDSVEVCYEDLLKTHEILFADFYPWAGQDRLALAPSLAVAKGPLNFAHPKDIRRAVECGLNQAHDKWVMATKPGKVLGLLTYAHPFLEGNGRALMTVHTLLTERAGIGIDWSRSEKPAFLEALSLEIDDPGKGHLDSYLQPFVGPPLGYSNLSAQVSGIEGLRA